VATNLIKTMFSTMLVKLKNATNIDFTRVPKLRTKLEACFAFV